jgi:hypothetical protein
MTEFSEDGLPEWTGEELAILRSADGDRPPARSLSATLAAVGTGGALASGAVAAKGASVAAGVSTAKWTTLFGVSKWVGLAMIGGVLVTGTVVVARHAERRAAMAVEKKPVAALRGGATRETPEAATPPEPPAAAAIEAKDPTPPNAAGHKAVVRSQPDISLEIAALDEARTALRQGRAQDALGALDRYGAEYGKNGGLRVEATVLRIDALIRSGNRGRATALASAFLARNPKSPYAARVRALLE